MNSSEYFEKVKKHTPSSPLLKDCAKAFFFGGMICTAAELLYTLFIYMNLSVKDSRTCVSLCIIFLTAVFTGIGIYDRAAKHAGAGFAVPITGFANSVCAPAVEHSSEGYIHGTAVKMFSLAGPVIVYGCLISSVYGILYYFFGGL